MSTKNRDMNAKLMLVVKNCYMKNPHENIILKNVNKINATTTI